MKAAEFGEAVAQGLRAEDGAAIAPLFSMQAKRTRRCAATVADAAPEHVQALLRGVRLPPVWAEVVVHYLRSGALLFSRAAAERAPADSWHQASEALTVSVGAFLRAFGALEAGRWALPLLYALLRDLRWVAGCADEAANSAAAAAAADAPPPAAHRHTEECARLLSKAFSTCIGDRQPDMEVSRKWGTYAVVGMVFRTYFQVRRPAADAY